MLDASRQRRPKIIILYNENPDWPDSDKAWTDRMVSMLSSALQEEGYPDLGSLWISRSFDQVFEQTVALAKKRGWEIVTIAADDGRIEATDTTPIMGFKDDIVIRVQAMGGKTRVDMRSASRVGESDLGVNAVRIRLFLDDLEKL